MIAGRLRAIDAESPETGPAAWRPWPSPRWRSTPRAPCPIAGRPSTCAGTYGVTCASANASSATLTVAVTGESAIFVASTTSRETVDRGVDFSRPSPPSGARRHRRRRAAARRCAIRSPARAPPSRDDGPHSSSPTRSIVHDHPRLGVGITRRDQREQVGEIDSGGLMRVTLIRGRRSRTSVDARVFPQIARSRARRRHDRRRRRCRRDF